MLKSELCDELNKKIPGLDKYTVELSVNCILNHITTALTSGDRIEIRDFGSFNLHHRPARLARNPKTGEIVNLPSKSAAHFKPGKQLRDRVDATRTRCKIEE